MDIKRNENGTLTLRAGESTLLLNPEGNKTKVQKYKETFVVDLTGEIQKEKVESMLIQNPGEYEMEDIFVMYQKIEGDGKVVYMNIGDVNVCYIESDVKKLRRYILDEIENVNVLIVAVSDDGELKPDAVWNIVGEVSPKLVIPLFDGSGEKDKFQKVFGVQEFVEEKRIKVNESDFNDDDAPLRVVVLKTGE